MYSSAPSFETSFDLKLSGSSSTSPSRLPRMLVENHPDRPSMRALRPGATTVFIHVCPVLKSLPAMGTLCSLASARAAGEKTGGGGGAVGGGAPPLFDAPGGNR